MAWYAYIALFFSGIFLANGVPHFVQGMCGHKFQSPFASPPGVGESSPCINVIWGVINFVVGYVLLTGVGNFVAGLNLQSLLVGAGILVMGLFCASHFGKVRTAT